MQLVGRVFVVFLLSDLSSATISRLLDFSVPLIDPAYQKMLTGPSFLDTIARVD